MKKPKPPIDENGEIREWLAEDLKRFRPIAEVVTPSLAANLGIESREREEPLSIDADNTRPLVRNQGEARKIAAKHYPFRCCVVCGLQLPASLMVAHLDHHAGNNDPDNLTYLCGTHHWMYDAGLYPIEAIKLPRAHWQRTAGKPDHKPRMKDAGAKAARTRKRRAAARKAVQTRRWPPD
jgi:HNH endonuclease